MDAMMPAATMRSLLTWLLLDPFREPDAGSATILVDEFAPLRLQTRGEPTARYGGQATHGPRPPEPDSESALRPILVDKLDSVTAPLYTDRRQFTLRP
jgi:hypothetical protein